MFIECTYMMLGLLTYVAWNADICQSIDQDDDWNDLLSQRHISEIYYLWKLAGGDLESSLRKAGQIHQQPSILKLPQ